MDNNKKQAVAEILKRGGSILRGAAAYLTARGIWLARSARGRKAVAGVVAAGAVAGAVALQPVCLIEPGEVGVRANLLTGNRVELRQGWALLVPHLHRLRRYTLRDQTYHPERSVRAADAAPYQSVEGLSIGVDVTVRYALDAERVMTLAQKLPDDVGREIVDPQIEGVVRRTFAQHTVREIFSTKRGEIQKVLLDELAPLLAQDGVLVRSVLLGNVDLPAQYRTGVEALLAEELHAEKMRYTLELKDKEVKQFELEGEAEKVKREKAAEAAASEEIIAARAKAEAMRHILPFKEKEIEQRRLEAEASRVSRITQANGEAEAHRIEAAGEADARRKLAESDAYRVEVTGKAASEQLARDAELISRNPLLIQKTLADKLSDKIQVIIAPPQAGGFFAAGLLGTPPAAEAKGPPPVANREPTGEKE